MDLDNLSRLQTEAVNPQTSLIDKLSTLQMCTVMNQEDHRVAASVTPCLPRIAAAIDALARRIRRGGRVVYVGAGTSGRLGILDASEIPPTFAAPPEQFIGLIAGGDAAIRRAQEGAEDSLALAEADMVALKLRPELDSVVGIAASGRTPYVLGCIAFAKRTGCMTIGVVCVEPSALGESGDVDFLIAPLPGPEVVSGSTRLKAGTATKLVLNMLSTGTMIRVGKTYGNTMVDLVASNAKLQQRSRNILRRLSVECASMSNAELDSLLSQCKGSVKLALLVVATGRPVEQCCEVLEAADQQLAKALELAKTSTLQRPGAEGRQSDESTELILCIDGGGSKCAAVVADKTGAVLGRGETGPCNITDGTSLDDAMATLSAAIESAMQNARKTHTPGHPESTFATDHQPAELVLSQFSKAWIALAGLDRPGLYDVIGSRIAAVLGRPAVSLRLTNDVNLLAAAMTQRPEVPSAIVLIAGTGSVAMRYTITEPGREPTRTARSGGWGHLLGDEGGGYSIGLEAIKHTLAVCEENRLGLRSDCVGSNLGRLEQAILQRFGVSQSPSPSPSTSSGGNMAPDLLSEVLLSQRGEGASVKSRIAAVAQLVVNLAREDATAMAIVISQVKALVDTVLGRLINPKSQTAVAPEQTGLILSGGVLKHELYRGLVLERLAERDIKFAYIETVMDASALGAKCLVHGV
ncbi:hypothetical protein BDW72DRAFT_209938 [Aspergillus terricola var. indicus]